VLAPSASLCLVANDFDYLMHNGGIGTHNWLLAHLLASHGWRVHVLYCGDLRRRRDMLRVGRRLEEAGIGWSYLEDFKLPPPLKVSGSSDILHTFNSDRVRYALEELHEEHRFDFIEFGEWAALGFRAIQAKRAGLAFGDVQMIVKLHSSSQWMREGNHHWFADSAEAEVDYCERYAFEHADMQLSPTGYMFDYARRVGWNVRPDARVLPYPYPSAQFVPQATETGTPELVFFGRLETRKGLELFIRAVKQLTPAIPVTFLGRVNTLGNGQQADQYIRKEMAGRPYRLLTNYNREQALGYLAAGDRLAVLASRVDNSPFTVIECVLNGIPFLASRVGGIPELITDPEARQRLLFEPTVRDLAHCLQSYLTTQLEERAALRQRLRERAGVAANNQQVVAGYDELLQQHRRTTPAAPAAPEDRPLVSVAIAYYNLGEFLPQTLASLVAQTYPNLEVIVINDGSTDPMSLQVFAQEQARYPHFRFLSQENAGIGATRNRGLAEARGEYFIPMDADNIARPDMVERMVEALRRNPDVAAMTCYYLAFEDSDDLADKSYCYAYRPTGGPQILSALKNVYGDANAIFRTEVFRSVNGYETDRDSSWEDFEAFLKLVNAGHRLDTIPDYLFYYRHLETGFSRITDHYLNERRILRQLYRADSLPVAEKMALFTALLSLQKRNTAMHLRMTSIRYRMVDFVHDWFARVPAVKNGVRWLLRSGELALNCLMPRTTLQQRDKPPLRTSA
jgi:glycosyltransferase involved in cell wall biosynthesis